MKYAPKKVFIRENGGYREISYEEFCRRKDTDRSYAQKFFIPVQGCLIETERRQYVEFYRDKERWRYLQKLDADHRLLSIDALKSHGENSFDFIKDEKTDVARLVTDRIMLNHLRVSLTLLAEEEQKLVREHFFEGKSQVELSRIYGINQSSISRRILKILKKLRETLENRNFRA